MKNQIPLKAFLTLTLLATFASPVLPESYVSSFQAVGTVGSVHCFDLSEPAGASEARCTLNLVSTFDQRRVQTAVACETAEAAEACSWLEAGLPVIVFGKDLGTYKTATHVGVLISGGAKTDNPSPPFFPGGIARLRVGQSLELPGGNLNAPSAYRVEFAGVASDSRCPIDVHCVWEGEAVVELDVWGANGFLERLRLKFPVGASAAQKVGGLSLRILDLDPDRRSGHSIHPKEYSVLIEYIFSDAR